MKAWSRVFGEGGVVGIKNDHLPIWKMRLALLMWVASKRADAVVFESALLLVLTPTRSATIIWDTNGCETAHYDRLPKSFGNKLRRQLWRVIEWRGCARSSAILAINHVELDRWHSYFPRYADHYTVVDHLPTLSPLRDALPAPAPGLPARYALFVCGPAKHNLEAAHWACSTIPSALSPDSALVLAGKGTDELSTHYPGVVGLGFVDDIDAVIVGATVCIDPLATSAGVELKVLHYLRLGQRVIGTKVAFEGLEGAPGCITAERGDFAAAVRDMLDNDEPEGARESRRKEQAAWVADQLDPSRPRAQWRALLATLKLV
jgi:hypothetical protein